HRPEEFVVQRAETLAMFSSMSLAWVLPVALFVGIYEEILFRGFVLTRLRSAFRGPLWPILLSSVAFGAVHFAQGPVGMIQTSLIALVLSAIATYARSLWPAIL